MTNATVAPTRCPKGIPNQPVARIQWLARWQLRANDYNPNHVAPPEMRLLKASILEDGWTQPIVVRLTDALTVDPTNDQGQSPTEPVYEVVDGFHRYTVAGDKEVAAQTGGLVPCVILRESVDPAHQRMSTIRHNRARGNHAVLKMADIVAALVDEYGLPREEVEKRLQMEDEEVDRLYARGEMIRRGPAEDRRFNNGWVPGGDE